MLRIGHDSERFGRRDFLTVGSLALGGMSLSNLLAAKAAAVDLEEAVRDKAVVFLFLHGGPTQTETFDPKMTAPTGVCSVTGETPTKLPGVTFGSTFTKLAALADKLSVVRSFTTGNGNHDIKPVVCKETLEANMGALYARVVGTNHPQTGMPTNAALFPRAVDPETQPANHRFGKFYATGLLGKAYAPFIPGGDGNLQKDMTLSLAPDRFDDRRSLLTHLDSIRRSADASGMIAGMDKFQQQAFSTILGGVARAFDLSEEDPRTVARYDTAPLVRPENISRKWNNYNNYVDNAKTLGKLMLMARRLCEAGCGFVTVTTNFVWDMHADRNNATIDEGMQYCGLPFDHAVSAFIEDIHARGLQDKILLVACGEMGRTPKVNNRGGRDHWGGIAPLLLSGGGWNTGQVIGQSTRDAGRPATEPMTIDRLRSTIMHTLFDPGQVRLMQNVPNDVVRTISSGEPIPGLL